MGHGNKIEIKMFDEENGILDDDDDENYDDDGEVA